MQSFFLKKIKNNLSLEQLTEFINSIEKDAKKFIEVLVKDDVIIHRPDLVRRVDEDNDFANLSVGDFISYHFTKGNDPVKELNKVYALLSKKLVKSLNDNEFVDQNKYVFKDFISILNLISEEIVTPHQVHRIIQAILISKSVIDQEREHVWVLLLDNLSKIMSIEEISKGTQYSATVCPREVFCKAIKERAARIILVHNHPSGNIRPSKSDLLITRTILKAGQLVSIPVWDHIIIGNDKFFSFSMEGLMVKLSDNSIIDM